MQRPPGMTTAAGSGNTLKSALTRDTRSSVLTWGRTYWKSLGLFFRWWHLHLVLRADSNISSVDLTPRLYIRAQLDVNKHCRGLTNTLGIKSTLGRLQHGINGLAGLSFLWHLIMKTNQCKVFFLISTAALCSTFKLVVKLSVTAPQMIVRGIHR